MGRIAQKRLVRRLDFERALQKVQSFQAPSSSLEQYTVPTDVAAEMLFIAAYMNDNIIGKKVVDLGCGTGRLVIGALLLGAAKTVGIDIDKDAVKLAKKSAEKLGLQRMTCWIIGDIDILHGHFDTVLQNPPFGVQNRNADRKFLLKAFELAPRVYSLHKSGESNRIFIKRFIEKHGGKVSGMFPMKFNIPRTFEFHKKRKHEVKVDLYSIKGKLN